MSLASRYFSYSVWRFVRVAFAGLSLSVVVVVLTPGSPAEAYLIDQVAVLPDTPIAPTDPVTLEIDIITPNSPASLYRPTVVYVSGTAISVVMFATSGLLPTIDSLVESADLGTFEPGTYQYTVTLVPEDDPPFGRDFRVAGGQFTVVPEPTQVLLQGLALVAISFLRLCSRHAG